MAGPMDLLSLTARRLKAKNRVTPVAELAETLLCRRMGRCRGGHWQQQLRLDAGSGSPVRIGTYSVSLVIYSVSFRISSLNDTLQSSDRSKALKTTKSHTFELDCIAHPIIPWTHTTAAPD
jgi:hypothetical protein